MAEPSAGTGLHDRMDGRYRVQGPRELQGHQQNGLYSRRASQGRKEGGTGPVARQE